MSWNLQPADYGITTRQTLFPAYIIYIFVGNFFKSFS